MNVIWYKRDIRIYDHEPLAKATASKSPVLPLYVLEPSVWQAGDLSQRHLQFVIESLYELQTQLQKRGATLFVAVGEMEEVLEALEATYGDFTLFSHEENGTPFTFERDKRVLRWMRERGHVMAEYQGYGVTRRLKSRDDFQKLYQIHVQSPVHPAPKQILSADPDEIPDLLTTDLRMLERYAAPGERIRYGQQGGEKLAHETLKTFLEERFETYNVHISKPMASSTSCSRLSPYIAWGNISIRYIYQQSIKQMAQVKNAFHRRQLEGFLSRLHWHCHFIQRLEDEPEIAHETINPAFDAARTEWNEESYQRWLNGQTGIPLIDAAMRCLHKTGWVNFRSRAMVVSFVCNTLLLDWRRPSEDLAMLFLDYEPGIHFSQMQMQAGTTGFNTIRIYNPIKQGKDHDADGRFIRRFVPELKDLPTEFVHEPWKSPSFDDLGYPAPMVDVSQANGVARKVLWGIKATPEAEEHAMKKLEKHGSRKRQHQQKRDSAKTKKTTRSKKAKNEPEQLSLFGDDWE
ncbi:deoxyribodipyrimidine photo-lyase [Paenalkalicoccus suaedae]|uniref:Deoxyribodipyrimidine photo-lyase n=1 Tax=Paenalkalicoccus suaedae TaxID=2592382 RepID=A0A859FJV2_9BACI|nr:deoxyribodipyrimidine photo-lyase [Paenalkalicoccus suaedae]QKS73078.1 deoxyribodipyrimidine photo-lyase [Paenalkalicoccus suaedae]